MQGPGPDAWHPRPQFLFARGAGPLFNIGPYYFTTLVQLLGPVVSVTPAARGRGRRTVAAGPDAGTEFPVEVPTHVSVLTRFASGAVGTSVYSFDSAVRRQLFEITGAGGVLEVPVSGFDGATRLLANRAGQPLAHRRPKAYRAAAGWAYSNGPRRPCRPAPRASGELAYHVLDIMLCVEESIDLGAPVRVESTAPLVPPIPPHWDPTAADLRRNGAQMSEGYLAYATARTTQAEQLEAAIARLGRLGVRPRRGAARWPGPDRSSSGSARAWPPPARRCGRCAAGASTPGGSARATTRCRIPASAHPIVGVSQSGRSAETLAVLESVAARPAATPWSTPSRRPSPSSCRALLGLGNIPRQLRVDHRLHRDGRRARHDRRRLGRRRDRPRLGAACPSSSRRSRADDRSSALAAELFRTFDASSRLRRRGPVRRLGRGGRTALPRGRPHPRRPAMSTRQYLHGSMESAGDGVHVVFGDSRELDLAATLVEAGHQVVLVTGRTRRGGTELHVGAAAATAGRAARGPRGAR